MSRVAVIGAGAWGTTLAILLAENKHIVTLWSYERDLVPEINERRENCRFLPGFQLAPTITVTAEEQNVSAAEYLIFVVPTQFLRKSAERFASVVRPEALLISASKGIEDQTLRLPLQVLEKIFPGRQLCCLSGPNLSAEIARGLPAAAVVAARDSAAAGSAQALLGSDRFRVYTNDDPIGVQLGGALKNVIAIAAGVADGLGLGDNAKAALMVRGSAELARLGVALGARKETFAGLSGVGDLIVTCSSRLSRNHRVGEQLAKGIKLLAIQSGRKEVAEGVTTALAARELGEKHRIDLPITTEVCRLLYENKEPLRAMNDLLTRLATSE